MASILVGGADADLLVDDCLIDVKNTWVEPAGLVADRLRQVLRIVDPERVSVTPDCGFSQTARHLAVAKAKAMVDGVRIIRKELEKR